MPDAPAPRSPRLLLVALLGLGLVAACGGDDSGDASNATAPAASAAAGGPFPVELVHRYGTTVIPEAPQRVLTAGFNDADYALAFGVTPIAVRDFIGAFPEEARPWAQAALDGADPPKISNSDGTLNVEAIAAAGPDLIIAYSYLEEEEYEQLSQIAPTVVEAVEGSLWPAHTREVGKALGMEERAEELVAEVEAAFDEAKDAHPDFVGTTLAIQFTIDPSGFYLLAPDDPRVGLFTSLGFEMPAETGEVSPERVALLDQELLAVLGADESTYADQPLFQALDVVQEGRVAYLGGFEGEFAGAVGFDSPLSLPYALDIAVPKLAAALEGR